MSPLKSFLWPLQAISQALPPQGLIFDLGCGDGVVSQFLAQAYPQRQVVGIDQNSSRISAAQRQFQDLPNVSFKVEDINKVNLKSAAGCLLSDVLHHLSPASQLQLLNQISHQLKPRAVCLIKEINRQDMLRSKLSRLWDWLLYPQDQIHYFSAPELTKIMTQLGFKVKFKSVTPWFPGSVCLFTCTKQ